jgi:hypothetical protein
MLCFGSALKSNQDFVRSTEAWILAAITIPSALVMAANAATTAVAAIFAAQAAAGALMKTSTSILDLW